MTFNVVYYFWSIINPFLSRIHYATLKPETEDYIKMENIEHFSFHHYSLLITTLGSQIFIIKILQQFSKMTRLLLQLQQINGSEIWRVQI
jgi:hypothetical protein